MTDVNLIEEDGVLLTGEGATATMLFTDIEGSTRLLQHLGEGYTDVLLRHNQLLRGAIAAANGTEVSTKGDSFFAVFTSAEDAVNAALDAQRRLAREPWQDGVTVRVRMGIHVGTARQVNEDYIGLDVHRASRIADAARGGQVLLSRATQEALGDDHGIEGLSLRPLGRHRLKDLRYPETLFDLVAPDLPVTNDPIRSLSNRPTNLSLEYANLFGRDDDVDAVLDLLMKKNQRIVTIYGTGGVGKSSLARKVGAVGLERFPDGVHLVQLGGITDPNLVFPTVATTIGVRDFPGRPVIEDVASDIGNESRLLIFDTFEHLVEAGQGLVYLIESCPNLHILITSRAALGLRQEATFAVEPLRLPARDATLADAAANPCVALFARSASEHEPSFELTEANAPVVANICRKLEGIPLAIELGAARIKLLSPAKLLDRLTARLSVLKGGRVDETTRYRTLREAIEWSDNLLDDNDRAVFQRLGVFNGGFALEDAEDVLAVDLPAQTDVMDAVDSLVGKSLLRKTNVNGEPRFSMFDMIREYATETLTEHGLLADVRCHHLRHYSALAEVCAGFALHRDQQVYVMRFATEADNIRAALGWALENDNIEATARLVYAMHWYWISQAQFTEAHSWFEKALLLAEKNPNDKGSALIWEAACSLSMASGDYVGGYPHGEKALKVFQALGDLDGEMRVRITHSICATVVGELEDPSEILTGTIGHFTGKNDNYTVLGLILLGEGARMVEMYDAAEECYSQALEILGALGDVFWPGHMMQNIAHFRLKEKNWEAAGELLAHAYDLAEDYDFPVVTNLCVAGFAGVALHRGDPETAARIMGAADHNLSKIGVAFEPTDAADIATYGQGSREILGEEAYEKFAAEGRDLEWDTVRAMARNWNPGSAQ